MIMKESVLVKKRIEKLLLDDKVSNQESLARLLKYEVVSAISTYANIDTVSSYIEIVFEPTGLVINAKIKTNGIKRFGTTL